MNEEDWKYILQILKELEDENGYVTFPVSAEFDMSQDYKFYTDDIMKMIHEEFDGIDTNDTSIAESMLNDIGIKT